MAYFNRDNRSGGRGFSGSKRVFNERRDRGPRHMYSAVCAKCGKECQVPFKPTGERPIFCNDCFDRDTGGSEHRRSDDRGSRSRYENHSRGNDTAKTNDQFNTLNAKLDKIISLLSPETSYEKKNNHTEEAMKDMSDISQLLGEPPKDS
jgi:CxxC-x17-CxxC domain-containing protein